jgi:hypothetical protein
MPYDKVFDVNGNQESCHGTGYEVITDTDEYWWDEYIDSEGEYHYAR